MAGNINGTSVIWVAGETTGRNNLGSVVNLSTALPESNQSLIDYVDYTASGIVAGEVDLTGYATETYADNVVSGYATTGYADSVSASGVSTLRQELVASGIL